MRFGRNCGRGGFETRPYVLAGLAKFTPTALLISLHEAHSMADLRVTMSNPEGVHAPAGRYYHLARMQASELLFLAGQVALDIDGNIVGNGDVGVQTRQAFQNIGRVLESAGASYGNIVQLTTYLVGRESVQPYFESRAGLFDEIFADGRCPPNTLLVISGLATEEMLVEVVAVAALH